MSAGLRVYHLVPPDLVGHVLHPLNALVDLAPDVAEAKRAKYAGREALLERRVPRLGCLWNDVLHCGAVDPRRIKRIFEEEGFTLGAWRWFAIPVTALEPERTVIYHSRVKPFGDFDVDPRDVEPFSVAALVAARDGPIELREHIGQARSEGRRPLVFAGCPHVLYRGTIDVRDVPIVEG